MCELSPAHARNRARARDLAVDSDCEQEHEWDQEILILLRVVQNSPAIFAVYDVLARFDL